MDAGIITVVTLGAAAAFTLKSIVEAADTAEKTVRYVRRAKRAFNRAFIGAMVYTRRRSSRLLNFRWIVFTGLAIVGPDDPPPRPPGGGRKMKPGPIATVGFGTRVAEPKVLCSAFF